jgi:hypothetical protein
VARVTVGRTVAAVVAILCIVGVGSGVVDAPSTVDVAESVVALTGAAVVVVVTVLAAPHLPSLERGPMGVHVSPSRQGMIPS